MKTEQDEWPPAPRKNRELSGHEAAEQTLLSAWKSGRMPHAWLISGPRGVGKATLAYRVARFVLAEAAGAGCGLFGEAAPAPDGLVVAADHPVARRVDSGGHSDLLTVTRSPDPKSGKLRSGIVVDDVRRLGSFLALTTGEGSWRVVIVDAADELNRSAANALLKGLEEPPARTLFLLVAHMPGRLLPTIRSRCRALALAPLPENTIVDLLAAFAPDMASADARALAQLSDGSIGEALTLAAGDGLDLSREVDRLMGGLRSLDVVAVHALGDRVARAGAEESFLTLGRLVERSLAGRIRQRARGEGAGPGAASKGGGGLAKWLEVWENVGRLFVQAGSINLNRKQVVVSAFLALEAAARG